MKKSKLSAEQRAACKVKLTRAWAKKKTEEEKAPLESAPED